MTTGKTIALTRRIFVGKVMSLLFNMLSTLVTTFLPRSNHPDFTTAVTVLSDFGGQVEEICHYFHFFPFYLSCSKGAEELMLLNCGVGEDS